MPDRPSGPARPKVRVVLPSIIDLSLTKMAERQPYRPGCVMTQKVLRSCIAMYSALLIALAYGAIAGRIARTSAASIPIVGGLSVALLVVATAQPESSTPPNEQRNLDCLFRASLPVLALALMVSDVYRHVSRISLLPQVLSTLPFLLAISQAVCRRDGITACGATGFFAAAVALLYCNRDGGGMGFFSVSCR